MSKLKALLDVGSAMVKTKRMIPVAVVAAGLYSYGGPLFSYVSTASRLVSNNVYESLPVEFEIERAKTMINDLIPDIKQNMVNIAKEEVSVRKLREEVERDELVLNKREVEIKDFSSIVKQASGQEFVKIGERHIPYDMASQQLERAFQRYKWDLDTFHQRQEMLASQETGLVNARNALEMKLESKRDLEVEVENLAARLQSFHHEKSSSAITFDESKFAHCRDLVDSLRARLDVAEHLVATGSPIEYVPANSFQQDRDIVSEIDSFFSKRETDTKIASLD